MTTSIWSTVAAVVAGLALAYALLLGALLVARPGQRTLAEALRLLPDVVRLLRRLAGDRSVPRGVRVRIWLLLAYLALPFDLVPDFVPVLGYADDAVVVVLVLRSVARAAGTQALARHWPGPADGLSSVTRLARLPAASAHRPHS